MTRVIPHSDEYGNAVNLSSLLMNQWQRFIQTFDFDNKPTFLVAGAGLTGLSVTRFLSHFNCRVIVLDSKSPQDVQISQQFPKDSVQLQWNWKGEPITAEIDAVLLSPGFPRSEIVGAIKSRPVPILNDLELFYHFFEGTIAAVTGTNGKSTVTTLLGNMLTNTFASAGSIGNIGLPCLDWLSTHVGKSDKAVIEISSFQIESLHHFQPDFCIITNLAPDHLDRYDSMEEYYKVKMKLAESMHPGNSLILNADDVNINKHSRIFEANTLYFSISNPVHKGIWLDDLNVVHNLFGRHETLFNLENVKLKGRHNQENILSATLCALLMGVEVHTIEKVVRSFKGLKHRFELIASVKGISFINDSKATNFAAVYAAIREFEQDVILLMGGRDKGEDASLIGSYLKKHVRKLFVFGEAAKRFEQDFNPYITVESCESLPAAVWAAYREAQSGETVLLAPGCSSYDYYRNFEERGDHFRRIIEDLTALERN